MTKSLITRREDQENTNISMWLAYNNFIMQSAVIASVVEVHVKYYHWGISTLVIIFLA